MDFTNEKHYAEKIKANSRLSVENTVFAEVITFLNSVANEAGILESSNLNTLIHHKKSIFAVRKLRKTSLGKVKGKLINDSNSFTTVGFKWQENFERWRAKLAEIEDDGNFTETNPTDASEQCRQKKTEIRRLLAKEQFDPEKEEEIAADTFPNIERGFFDTFPECLNILVVGETGVGKSTFINGLVNYLKYGTLEEALNNQVEILIKTYFTSTDEDYNRTRIECDPTIKVQREGIDNDENTVEGQSATQAPKSYFFSWGPNNSKKGIRIIDTPGFGDVRGEEQDKHNLEKTMSFIANLTSIHAICVLLKPNESRLDRTFRHLINELLSHLHPSAYKNILFCFTNSRQSLYRPGDTASVLQSCLDDVMRNRGINISLDRQTMFCFDSESFRFLCALREGATFDKTQADLFNLSWSKSVEESFRMLKRISELPVYNVNENLSVTSIRALILALAWPLAEVVRNHILNVTLIEDKIIEVDHLIKQGKEIIEGLQFVQIKLEAKEIDYPMTVCTARCCVDNMRVSVNSIIAETVYKTVCHSHCNLSGVQASVCPNEELQNCWAMARDIYCHCSSCQCPWSAHMHIRYKLEKTIETIADPLVHMRINNICDNIQTANIFIENLKQRKHELENEGEQITNSCAEFVVFLKKNSILPSRDIFKEWIEHLIKEEGGSDVLVKRLQSCSDVYTQEVKKRVNHQNSTTCNTTIKDIHQMLHQLKRMKNCEPFLNESQRLDILGGLKEQTSKDVPFDLSSCWLGQATRQLQKG